jgi:hypothetical protein
MLDMVLVPYTITRGELQKKGWETIRAFVERKSGLLAGRTLDFGCGDQRYKPFVKGEYCPWDPNVPACKQFPAGKFDSILTTQSLTYVDDPCETARALMRITNPAGVWVVSYNSSWYEFEPTSGEIWRFAKAGMEKMLRDMGAEIISSEPILAMQMNGWQLNLTYGLTARWQ